MSDHLFNCLLLYTHFLQNSNTKSLGDTSIFLVLQDANHLFTDSHAFLYEVIDSLRSRCNNWDEGTDGMFETMTFDLQQVEHKVAVLLLGDQKHIVSDQLSNQGSSLFRWDLEGVYSQREEDFNYVFNIVFVFCFDEFHFVLWHYCFWKQLWFLIFNLWKKNFMVFSKLNFVVFDAFAQIVLRNILVFQWMKMLETINGNGEDLSSRVKHVLMLFV